MAATFFVIWFLLQGICAKADDNDNYSSTGTSNGNRTAVPQLCWKANGLCDRMKSYILQHNLTHVYVGASAKCAGTFITNYFGMTKEWRKTNTEVDHCPWAFAGSHLYVFGGLRTLLRAPCAQNTLFLLSVREKMSWVRSALEHVCWKTTIHRHTSAWENCRTTHALAKMLQKKPHELGQGPNDWLDERMIRSPKFHVLLVDYAAATNVVSCFPGALKIKDASPADLARETFNRNRSLKKANVARKAATLANNASDAFILTMYEKGNPKTYWLQPYVQATNEHGCKVASGWQDIGGVAA